MFKIQVLYTEQSFSPVTYTADSWKRDGDILIMNNCKDDVVTEVSYIHLSNTTIVSVTEINGGKVNESTR